MRSTVTQHDNAKRNSIRKILFILGCALLVFLFTVKMKAAWGADESSASIRQVRLLQVPTLLVNFKFQQFSPFWIYSDASWKKFWNENSRNQIDAPALNLDWSKESLLAVFWPSKDDLIRLPFFMGSEMFEEGTKRDLRLSFALNTPCAGLVTDQSPVQWIVIDRSTGAIDSVSVQTETTRSTNCY